MEKLKLKKSVVIRQRKEEEKLFKQQNEGNLGAAKASLNNVPSSPRKMRLVADLIRGLRVDQALNILKFDSKSCSPLLEKLLLSAIANWTIKNANVNIENANLFIKEIFVNEGRMLKRMRPAPQGRGYRIRKRSNHVTIVLDSAVAE